MVASKFSIIGLFSPSIKAFLNSLSFFSSDSKSPRAERTTSLAELYFPEAIDAVERLIELTPQGHAAHQLLNESLNELFKE